MFNSMRLKFTLVFIGLAVGPILLIAAVVGQYGFAILEQQSRVLQHRVTSSISSTISSFIEMRENELVFLDELIGFSRFDPREQRKLLSNLLLNRNVYQELVLLDSEGQEQIRLSRSSVILDDELKSRASNVEYLNPMTRGEIYFSPVHFDEDIREPLMTIAIPLIDPYSGKLKSVLMANFRFKAIWDLLADLELPYEEVYVTDQSGQVVAHKNPAVVLRGSTANLADNNSTTKGLSGTDVVRARSIVQFGTQKLIVIAEQSVSNALELATNITRVVVVIACIAFLIAITLTVFTTRRMIKPIEILANSTRAVSRGDFSFKIPVHGQDEVGRLATSFNQMASELENSYNKIHEHTIQLQTKNEQLQKQSIKIQNANEQMSREIVTRKHIEDTLHSEHLRFVTVMDSLDAAVYATDMDTYEILFVNKYLRDLLGDVSGKTCWKSLQAGQTGPCSFCTNNKLLDSTGKPIGPYVWEFQNTINGHWYQCRDQAIYWPDGRLVRLETATDITTLKLVEEQLKLEHENFLKTFAAAPIGLLLLDKNNMITEVNRVAANLVLREPAEVIGKCAGGGLGCVHSFEDLRGCGFGSACSKCPLRESIESVLVDGHSIHGAEINLTLLIDGTPRQRWLRVNVEPVELGGNQFSVVAIDDITEQKQSKENLHKYALQQKTLLQEVNHRVKNNLTAIISMLHLEEDRAAEQRGENGNRPLRETVGRVEGLLIVHSLLSASKWEPLHIAQLCKEVVAGTIRGLSASQSVNLDVYSPDILVEADQAHNLALVLNELVTNTVKYGFREDASSNISIVIESRDGEVHLIYRDNGTGFPEAVLQGRVLKSCIGVNMIVGIIRKSMRGELELLNEGGAVIKITFPGYDINNEKAEE